MMKNLNIKALLGALLVLVASSCEDYLDVNKNPNAPTDAGVEFILPGAITSSASLASTYNNYGGHFGGFISNAGGFSGFGVLFSYNITPGTYDGLWTNMYQDPLKDLNTVLQKTNGYQSAANGVESYMVYHAVAKIMTAVNYQRLVDAFGDVPYTQALQGLDNLAPEYDDAETIYHDLYDQLTNAVVILDTALNNLDVLELMQSNTDPLFKEYLPATGRPSAAQATNNMQAWIRYANTLKLRILLRLRTTPSSAAFVAAGYTELNTYLTTTYPATHRLTGAAHPGFLTVDAIVNPGYETNRPNPIWNTWGRTTANALANSSRIPTTFSFAFYNGTKIDDDVRGAACFPSFPNTPTNQLGNEDNSPPQLTGNTSWGNGTIGILKGAAMGMPLMLAAESYFLQAEARLYNLLPALASPVATYFDNGMTASFNYTYKNAAETVTAFPGGLTAAATVAAYKTSNPGNYLVNIASATNTDEQLEAIITQKYIALNMVNSDEAWNEFRRTGYPDTQPGDGPSYDIASIESTSTRTDRMIGRVKYPSSEQAYNSGNFRDVNQFTERIFWDPN